jgi:lipopolysaccharide biosynthesis glycosyltransferase
VDRCIYNTVMEDDYLHEDDGTCLTNETTCRDCRRAQWEDLVLLHYTMCTKPWTCQLPRFRKGDWHLCKRAHQEWFRLRYELEHPGVTITHKASTALNNTYGYCSEYGFFDQRKDAYTSGLVDAG